MLQVVPDTSVTSPGTLSSAKRTGTRWARRTQGTLGFTYRDPNYSAKDLAKELQTNTRYLSAVVNSRFGMNYSCLLNEYRVKDALHLLTDKRYADKNVEEISTMVGFANRQSFYAAFYKNVGETPNGYRKKRAVKSK